MHEKLPRVDWMVGTGLVALAILSVFYGSAELTSNIAAGLIGFLGRTVAGRNACRRRCGTKILCSQMMRGQMCGTLCARKTTGRATYLHRIQDG